MKQLKGIVTVIVLGVVYQVVAYVIVKVTLPFIQMFPPYSFVGEGINKVTIHTFFGVVAFLMSLYHYPVDLENKHQE